MRTLVRLVVLLAALATAAAFRASAFPSHSRATQAACVSCHTGPAGGAELTAAGKAFQAKPAQAPPPSTGATYVGSEKCRACHPAEHQSWSATAHATALDTLRLADSRTAAAIAAKLKIKLAASPLATDACVTCHVTGHRLPGGYPAPDSARNAALAAVGCESCHGPGSRHLTSRLAEKKSTIHGAVSEKTCVSCHTAAVSPDFDYAEFRRRGVHALKAADE